MAWLKLIRSGSNAELNNLVVTNSVTASYFKGDGSEITNVQLSATSSYFRSPKTFGITIDGGGSAITTGIKGDITIPFTCYIDSWYLSADQNGSIVIDVWKDTQANYPPTVLDSIAGSEKPSLTAQNYNSDTNLTTWTKQINSGDIIRFNVDSVSTITRANLVIKAWL